MGKKQTLNGDWELVSEPIAQKEKPIAVGDWEVLPETKTSNPYYEQLDKEDRQAKVNQIVNDIPDLNDSQKQIWKDLVIKGTSQEDLSNALLTLQGKHPKQNGNDKYYYNAKGIPTPLEEHERPPVGFDAANDLYGTQKEANDDSFFTSAGKHIYNGVLKGVLGLEGLANLPYGLATGEDADWYKSAKNRVESSLFKTPEYETENKLFDSKDIKGVEDFFDSDRYNLDANTVQGAALNGLESVVSFFVGTKGIGAAGKLLGAAGEGVGLLKAGTQAAEGEVVAGSKLTDFIKGTSKAGVLAQNFGGTYSVTLPEVLDYMEENGVTGPEKYRRASIIAVPIALTEMLGGVEGQFARNAAAKNAKSQMIKGLVEASAKGVDGKLSKEAGGELFKATTSEALKLQKSFARDVAENIGGEALTEGLQDLEKKGLAEVYDHLSKEDKFKENPFSLESFGEYYNSALNGAAGAGGMSTAATIQKRNIEIKKKQSENIFTTVQKGPEAVNSLIKNIGKAVDDGEITAEQGADAYYKVDQYTKYDKQTSGLSLKDEEKRRLFDLTFEKSNLETQIPTDYEIDKLGAIEQGIINSKKKQAKHLQDEIDKLILRDDVQNTTTPTAKKTEEEVAKDIEAEKEAIASGLKSGIKFKDAKVNEETDKYAEHPDATNETRSYEDFTNHDWNNKNASWPAKLKVFGTKLLSNQQAREKGVSVDPASSSIESGIISQGFKGKIKGRDVVTFNVKLPDGKEVKTASSIVRPTTKDELGGYTSHFRQEMLKDRNSVIGTKVAFKVHKLKDSGRIVVSIYNPENGKHLAFMKERHAGNSIYNKKDEKQLGEIQDAIELPPNSKKEITVNPTEPIVPITEPVKPISTADVKLTKPKVVLGTNSREQYISDQIEELKKTPSNYDEDTNYEKIFGVEYDRKQAGGKKTLIEKEQNKETEKTPGDVLKKVNLYNTLSKKEKKSEQGVSLFKSINEDTDSIDHSVNITDKGKLKLINQKGKQVYREAVKRSKDVIERDKQDAKETKLALKMVPQSLDHLIIMDVANGEAFNIGSIDDVGANSDEVPALMKSKDGGIDIRDYKQRLSEMMGLVEGQDALQGDSDTIAKESWEILSGYLTGGGRAMAIRDAKDIYEESINEGLTHAEAERLQEENNLTDNEVAVIKDTVANATEEELLKAKEILSNKNNQNEETANTITSEINGTEEGSSNPFDESEREQNEGKGIAGDDGKGDVFQKSKELQYAEGQYAKAETELKAAKKALDLKRKELDKGLIEDQEDLFGERKSTDETSLFDERASLEGRNDAITPSKQRYENAVANYSKWKDKVKELGDSEETQMELFQKVSERKANVEKVVAKLKASMPNIKVVFDENLKAAGKWSPTNKTITINPYHAGLDTPIHEYGHVLIDAIGYNNKVIQAAIKQLKTSPLWAETKERYKELDEENLGKEVLAEAIGREGAGIFDKESDKSKFKVFLDYIFDWLKTKLGMNKNIAKSLAKQIIGGVGTKEMVGKSETEQLQKTKETEEEKKQRKAEKKAKRAEEQHEVDEMLKGREIKELSFEEMIDVYNHVIGYSKSIQDKYFGDVKIQIAYRLFTEKKNQLEQWQKEGKTKGYNEEESNKSDIKDKDVLMKNLSHMTQIVPELQAFSKMFEGAYFDMTQERYELKNELQKFGQAVIKEKNKKLGIVGRAKELFSSSNAKYFDFVENPKAELGEDEEGNIIHGAGYYTLEEGKKKGFSDAQMNFLKFMHKLQDERNAQLEAMGRDMTNEVLKVDKGVAEAWKTEGLMSAFSSFLGNGFNLRNVRITYNGKNMTYGEVEKDLIAKGNKGTIEKLVALKDMFKYNMAAKRQIQKGIHVDESGENELQLKGGAKYGIDPHGALINKFMKSRNAERGYSKDFYKAAFDFIDESTHSKHMQELLPYIDSIEYLNKMGLLDEEGNVLHGIKNNVTEWIEEWKNLHLFKVDKVGKLGPEADVAMKLLRTLTSQLVMAFNIKAGLINIAMGQYNNLRKETAKELAKGHKRMASNPKKSADILKKYQVISIDYDSNPKLFAGKLFDYLAHGLTRAGEYYIQGSMFIGLMTEAEYDSFEYKKNKDGVDELVYTGKDEEGFKDEMIKHKNRVSDIQGKYAEKDRRNFMSGEFGKMISQFKVWIPDWWKERFGEEYITADGETKKGSYRNFTIDAIKDLREQIKAEGPKAIWNNKEAMTNLKGALSVAILWSLAAAGDDDDKKRKKGDLLSQMTSNVLFVFDPTGLKFNATHPAAVLGTVEKFLTVFEDVVKGDGEKFGNDIVKVIPYNKIATQIPKLISGE